jgi:hypothetical protein
MHALAVVGEPPHFAPRRAPTLRVTSYSRIVEPLAPGICFQGSTFGGDWCMRNNRDESVYPATADRVTMLVVGVGAAMLALSLVFQYFRLVH